MMTPIISEQEFSESELYPLIAWKRLLSTHHQLPGSKAYHMHLVCRVVLTTFIDSWIDF